MTPSSSSTTLATLGADPAAFLFCTASGVLLSMGEISGATLLAGVELLIGVAILNGVPELERTAGVSRRSSAFLDWLSIFAVAPVLTPTRRRLLVLLLPVRRRSTALGAPPGAREPLELEEGMLTSG
jgi:hypothetical protein